MYRIPILRGLVLSVGSKTDSTVSFVVREYSLCASINNIYSNVLLPRVSRNT